MYGLLRRDIDYILEALKENPRIEKCMLFGSRALGNYKPGSDIDIAISGNMLKHHDINKLSGILNEKKPIPYMVDVVQFDKIKNKELVNHILTKGIVLYSKKDATGL